MDTSLNTFVTLLRFSSGRALFALHKVAMASAEFDADLSEVTAHVTKAVKQARDTRTIESGYARSQQQPKNNPKVGKVDVLVDRAVIAFRDATQTIVDAGPEDDGDDSPQLAADLLTSVFPRGVTEITQATFVEELSLVEGLLSDLKGKHAATITTLGLGRYVKRLAKVGAEYRAVQHESVGDGVDFSQVRAAREKMQQMLLEVVVMIAGRYPLSTKEHFDARRKLLGPVLEQNAAISSYLKSRRSLDDVDPETGVAQPPIVADPVPVVGTPEAVVPGTGV